MGVSVAPSKEAVKWLARFQPFYPSSLRSSTKEEIILVYMEMQANVLGVKARIGTLERELNYFKEQSEQEHERHKVTREQAHRDRDRRTRQLFALREMLDSFGHYSLSAKFDPERF